MVLKEVDRLMRNLENDELQANGGCTSSKIFGQLLAIYLYQNDLCNAKYLWKRIPIGVKHSSPELARIWGVGQRMWQRDWAAVHASLNVEWSEEVGAIMNGLKDNVRERAMTLISEAYSSLELSVLASMTGLTSEQAHQAAIERGWSIENTTVQPCKVDKDQQQYNKDAEAALTEDQLQKLTQFVSFLEN